MDHFTKEVLTPSISQVLNVSAATNIYRVRLTDAMVSSLQFSKVINMIIIFEITSLKERVKSTVKKGDLHCLCHSRGY